ncbi:MAG: phosphatase PAP2 family protein, partial [Chloroflexi bacterium]|nr:phosphatase PAP2 family protein [Chloroflexota bacterium]
MILATALSFHLPDSLVQASVLACAAFITLAAGGRSVGPGYGLLTAAFSLIAFAIVGNLAIPIAAAVVAVGFLIREALTRARTRRPGADLARELLTVLGGLALYTAGRFVVESDLLPALANTSRLIDLERALGLYVEPDLQSLVMRSDELTRIVNWTYSFGFLALVAATLLWLWVTDAPNYRLLRNGLAISALLAVPTILLFPAAPPRLTPDSGLLDTISLFGREHAFANEYAAIPSLHVGWMAAVGIVLG